MIKLYALYDQKTVFELTPYCKSIQWSGDKSQVARKLDVTLSYAIWDKNQPKIQANPGTIVWMIDENGKERFRGMVFDRELSSNEELKIVAYDYLIYLQKSKITYNFTNIVSEAAVEKIITDLGEKYNRIPTTNIPITKLIKNKSAYDAIMNIYTDISKKNGKQYIPIMDYDMVSVIEKGSIVADYTLKSEENLGETVFSDSISNMVNKVIIYDSNGYWAGEVDNADYVKKYGVLQEIYEIEEGKDPKAEANFMLHGIDQTIKCTALGNMDCITGYAIKANISYIDILQDVTMYIDADTHTWDVGTGKYTMELTVNLTNLMDRKDDN